MAFEAEGGGDFGPVEFQGGGALGMGVSGVLGKFGPGRMGLGAVLTPAAMSAGSMAMGCCWLEMALWKIDVEGVLAS